MKPLHTLLASVLAVGGIQAAVVVTDNGLTTPILGTDDTGYVGTTDQRFGWDSGEGLTQTFTVPTAGTIASIFLGYNAFENGDTITLTVEVNGSVVQSGIVLDGNNFSGTTSDDNAGPFYWMEFDLSAENVAVNAGSNSFTMNATANSGNSWALAPRYSSNTGAYAGGGLSFPFNTGISGDMAFAVTVVPEPSSLSLLLAAMGGLYVVRRRRRS